jgi:glycosyltransferase involved in cell wall biosynthesis
MQALKIGYEAKRVFKNHTGLGSYGRNLLPILSKDYPQHQYVLYTPEITPLFNYQAYANMQAKEPVSGLHKKFKSYWRSKGMVKDLLNDGIEVFHGLSHEIPFGLQDYPKIKSVVTIHDLIFERFPQQFKPIDRFLYRKKFKNACENAHHIIAISNQTKQDLIELYNIPAQKITICYQSSAAFFYDPISEADIEQAMAPYNLPERFLLSVGTVIERKNLLLVCQALQQIKEKIPLVIYGGSDSDYAKTVKEFIAQNNMEQQIIFLSNNEIIKANKGLPNDKDIVALYKKSTASIYMSTFEGFGLPVLDSIVCGTPTITSSVSCLPETGGAAAFYADPNNVESIANAIETIFNMPNAKNHFAAANQLQSELFCPAQYTKSIMDVYQKVMSLSKNL